MCVSGCKKHIFRYLNIMFKRSLKFIFQTRLFIKNKDNKMLLKVLPLVLKIYLSIVNKELV